MNDIMLDLETMSTAPNAAIVSIGAVRFDYEKRFVPVGDTFYCNVVLASSIEAGLHEDPQTVKWWAEQSKEAKDALLTNPLPLQEALRRFSDWAIGDDGDATNVKMWGNGAAFDCVVLRSAYKALGMMPPWNFRNDRCYRTIMAYRPTPLRQRVGVAHNALDDAFYQALCLTDE